MSVNGLKITEINYHVFGEGEINNSNIKAICSMVLNDVFQLHKVIIRKTANGNLIVQFPLQNNNKNNYFHPINGKFSTYLSNSVVEGYLQCLAKGSEIYHPAD